MREVLFYDSMKKADPDEVVATMLQAHKQLGIEEFVIDNVMTMDVDRGDNTAQAEAIDAIRVFASNYPVHVHVVAHPRKSGEGVSSPPAIAEIQGASEWGNMPDNIITVWRDVSKHERIAEMTANAQTFAALFEGFTGAIAAVAKGWKN
jgi:twinkle protein